MVVKKKKSRKGIGGAPSLYKPEYAKEIVPHMAQGLTALDFANTKGVMRQTLYRWAKAHPEFGDALKKAQEASECWWQKLGMALATGKIKGNPAVYCFNMKNRFGWRDVVEVEKESTRTLTVIHSKGTQTYDL